MPAPKSLEQYAVEINASFLRSYESRIHAGKLLLELRGKFDRGELTPPGLQSWPVWCRENIDRSRRDIEKVMKIASSPNPVAAHNEAKAKQRGYNTGFQSRNKSEQNQGPVRLTSTDFVSLLDNVVGEVDDLYRLCDDSTPKDDETISSVKGAIAGLDKVLLFLHGDGLEPDAK